MSIHHPISTSPERRNIDDHFVQLLATLAQLVKGSLAVVVAFGEEATTWTGSGDRRLSDALRIAARHRLRHEGPWGPAQLLDGRFDAWFEPWMAGRATIGRPGGPAVVVGLARRSGSATLTSTELAVVRSVTDLCASASRIARTTQALEDNREVEQLVAQVAERLMSVTASRVQEALDWTVEALARYLRADAAFLRRNDHDRGLSVLVAEYPRRPDAPVPDPLAEVAFDADPIFAATRHFTSPLLIRDPETVEPYAERIRQAAGVATFSGAGVPLVHGDVTEGVLGFVRISDTDWAEHEINALRVVASLLVQLIHRVQMAKDWRRSALTDDLTGLPNRRALLDRIDSHNPGEPLRLLFLDLDRFKIMNDHLGHAIGDRLLVAIAERICDWIGADDFAARLAGDEFVLLLGASHGETKAAAEEVLRMIAQPVVVGDRQVVHTGSIGLVVCDEPRPDGEELLRQADIAMYAAKARGRNQVVVFDEGLAAQVAEQSDTALVLRQAFLEDHLSVYYQPEFDVVAGRLTALEALVRWHHPIRGLLSAAEFVPLAEESHLIPDLGHWVLCEACEQMARWRRTHPDLSVVLRVNISPAELVVPGVVDRVRDCLEATGLPGAMLCLEITEKTAVINMGQTAEVLRTLRGLGVQLAIDDFGSGYSSLVQLKSFPVNVLKIDRAFVDGLATDPINQGIVESILRLADAFRLQVVAEGAETVADLDELVRLGVRRVQGYLVGPPAPPEEIEAIL